jgi:hypothetical protein
VLEILCVTQGGFAKIKFVEQCPKESNAFGVRRRRLYHALPGAASAVNPDEPRRFDESLIPERRASNCNLPKISLEMVDPGSVTIAARGVSSLIHYNDIASDKFRGELLNICYLTHEIIEPIRHDAAQILENRFERNEQARVIIPLTAVWAGSILCKILF